MCSKIQKKCNFQFVKTIILAFEANNSLSHPIAIYCIFFGVNIDFFIALYVVENVHPIFFCSEFYQDCTSSIFSLYVVVHKSSVAYQFYLHATYFPIFVKDFLCFDQKKLLCVVFLY